MIPDKDSMAWLDGGKCRPNAWLCRIGSVHECFCVSIHGKATKEDNYIIAPRTKVMFTIIGAPRSKLCVELSLITKERGKKYWP